MMIGSEAPVAIISEFEPQKFVSAMAYLVASKPGLTKKQLCKLLFLADKEHLLTYGRTITGNRYYAPAGGGRRPRHLLFDCSPEARNHRENQTTICRDFLSQADTHQRVMD